MHNAWVHFTLWNACQQYCRHISSVTSQQYSTKDFLSTGPTMSGNNVIKGESIPSQYSVPRGLRPFDVAHCPPSPTCLRHPWLQRTANADPSAALSTELRIEVDQNIIKSECDSWKIRQIHNYTCHCGRRARHGANQRRDIFLQQLLLKPRFLSILLAASL